MPAFFTQEELAIARDTDLPDLLSSLGYQVKRVGNYHTAQEMDSLRIKNRRTWFRYSEGIGGDAIAFVQHFCQKSFPEAVDYLLDFQGGARSFRASPPVSRREPVPFVLPPPAPDHRRVKNSAVALCCLYDGPLDTYLRYNPHLKQFDLCLDAVGPGQAAAERMRLKYTQKGYAVSVHTPPRGKDWNDYLQLRRTSRDRER